jgi:immune inhibitor A
MSGNQEVVMKRGKRIWWLGLVVLLLFVPAAVQAMPPHPRLDDKIKAGEVQLPNFMVSRAPGGPNQPIEGPASLIGNLHALTVLVKFSDHANTVTATFFDSLLFPNPVTYPSVRDFYQKVSYNKVDMTTFNSPSSLGWKQAPQTYVYYVNNQNGQGAYPQNCQKLAEDMVDALHTAGVDFSKYPDPNRPGYATALMMVHSGPGAEFTGNKYDIWSHSWVLANPRTYNNVTIDRYITMPEYLVNVSSSTSDMGIGVFCHEMGHGFWGLPDLYDTTYASNGIGNFSLMAGGSWDGPKGLGDSPAWPDAWCRTKMGFVNPTILHGKNTGKKIPQAANNPTVPTVFKLTSPGLHALEYFLVENRQQVTNYYDYLMPGPLNGLFIWHVDDAQSGNTKVCTQITPCSCTAGNHFLVALEQADNLLELEKNVNRGNAGDPFPGSTTKRSWTAATQPGSGSWYNCKDTKISITNISNSGALMTADIQTPGVATSPLLLLLLN